MECIVSLLIALITVPCTSRSPGDPHIPRGGVRAGGAAGPPRLRAAGRGEPAAGGQPGGRQLHLRAVPVQPPR